MLEAVIGIGVASTLGVAAVVALVWHRLRRDKQFWHSISHFDDELHRPEVLGFAVVEKRWRNGFSTYYARFVTMNDAANPEHDDPHIVIRMRPNGSRYAIIGDKLVHYLDMSATDFREDGNASILKSYKRNRYHDEIFTPLIEEAFKDE